MKLRRGEVDYYVDRRVIKYFIDTKYAWDTILGGEFTGSILIYVRARINFEFLIELLDIACISSADNTCSQNSDFTVSHKMFLSSGCIAFVQSHFYYFNIINFLSLLISCNRIYQIVNKKECAACLFYLVLKK